ncbi:DNA glycosylase AlkZ-like family protein [Paenibacillus wynnii]|uniref:DNA glycosylase AlkZ-like family protein n=1 Tax=Paenibacillus wynnii TaxID=268407 RepID=UPI0027934FBD|nr:crosslink repair DNA glycosylase YcaQ family protein [Paenibacillus wynnii]MDQ0192858.1 hypothetical protein [Paenibacillus wynnii]
MTLTDSRRAHEAIKGNLKSELIDGTEYWVSIDRDSQNPNDSEVYLLPGFDEYILGYKDRSAVLKPEIAPLIVPGNNGVFLATVVAGGRVVGTWKRNFKKKGMELRINPFESLKGRQEAVIQEADRYAAFIGLPILKIDFTEKER